MALDVRGDRMTENELREALIAESAAHPIEPQKPKYRPNGKPPDGAESPTTMEWYPPAIGASAFIGIAGSFVRAVEPHTEADPSFLLLQFLAYAGNAFGRNAYIYAGADRHYPNLFVCGVGPTSTGRKGSANGPVEMFFRAIDDDWIGRVQSGLSSGEGLIWCVRDPIYTREKIKGAKGEAASYQDVCSDDGIKDKRLVVRQSEFYGALQVMKRAGNTLSPTMRDAWDKDNLNSMVKNSPAKATGAHISIIANITREELLRGVLAEEMDNGFANRFLWCCSRRSKSLPEGGRMWMLDTDESFNDIRKRFNRIHYAVKGQVARDDEAARLWGYNASPGCGKYAELTCERHGFFGVATARAPAQVLRLSLIYALLDGCDQVQRRHLLAALEVWRYCDDSARYIFGDSMGDPIADHILKALRQQLAGLTRKEIYTGVFGNHKSAGEIGQALALLERAGLAQRQTEQSSGRPVERWFFCRAT